MPDNPLDMLCLGTEDDIKQMLIIAKGCGMRVASAVFTVDEASRLQQFTLVSLYDDPSNPREIILNSSKDS